MNTFQKYHNAIAYIEGLSNLPIKYEYMKDRRYPKLYLKRSKYFLNLIDNPHHGFRYIHITGTAGKGTVSTMLHSILSRSGKKAGLLTSPFVSTYIDKIKVGDLYISADEFADIVEFLKPFIDYAHANSPYGRPSYFEILFAVASTYFKRQKCEWVVLEVGCGGRYDYTNVIEAVEVAAITNIDADHLHLIGPKLEDVAYEKIGILKKGCSFFTTETRPNLRRIFKEECIKKKTKYFEILPVSDFRKNNINLVENIAAHLGIDNEYIKKGIQETSLSCRFEVVQQNPRVILDGAHNKIKMKSVIENLKLIKYNKLHLLIGMAENKDIKAVLKEIAPYVDSVTVTRFQVKERKCADPLVIKKFLLSLGNKNVSFFLDPHQGLEHSLSMAHEEDIVLITGSFFLVGEISKVWVSENKLLTERMITS